MAYPEDGAPLTNVQERTKTPDLTSATGQPGGGGSVRGLMDILQGLGSGAAAGGADMSTPEALLGLMQGPSFGQRMGAAASGGVAFMRGQPNPAVAMLEEQRRQQMGVMELLQRMQDRQDLKSYREQGRQDTRDLHKQNLLEKYTGDLIASSDPAANVLGWTTRGTQMAAAGFPIPPDVIQGLGRKDIPPDTLKQAVRLYGDVPFPEIMAMYKGLKPEHESLIQAAKNSDDYRKGLGLESRLEEQMKIEDHGIKKMAANLAQIREERAQMAEERQGKSLENQMRRTDLAEQRAAASESRAERALAQGDRRLDLTERRLDVQKAEWDRKFETKDDKKKASLEVMKEWLDELSSAADQLDKKGYLPKTAAGPIAGLLTLDPSAAKAAANRTFFPNDPAWTQWAKILQGGGVGFERSVLNDIGPRALAAYKGIIGFFDQPPTREAIRNAERFMRSEIDIAASGKRAPSHELVYQSGGRTFKERWKEGDPLPSDAKMLKIDGAPVP